jgi:hypothetical protein
VQRLLSGRPELAVWVSLSYVVVVLLESIIDRVTQASHHPALSRAQFGSGWSSADKIGRINMNRRGILQHSPLSLEYAILNKVYEISSHLKGIYY